MRTLLAYLSDPGREAWSRRAQAAVAGLLTQPGLEKSRGTRGGRPGADLAGGPRRTAGRGGGGPVTFVRAADASGCPVTVIIDARRLEPETAPLGTWSALVVIDDRRATVLADGGPTSNAGRPGCTGGTSSSSWTMAAGTAASSPGPGWTASTPRRSRPRPRCRAGDICHTDRPGDQRGGAVHAGRAAVGVLDGRRG